MLEVPAKGLVAITGDSGAGKSTLVQLLAGTLREPYEGTLEVLGKEWRSLQRDVDRQRLLRRIGFVPQKDGLVPDRTVAENLHQALTDAGTPEEGQRGRIVDALRRVKLGDHLDSEFGNLSGGQQRRAAIARVLARPVELIIADEPESGLDPGNLDGVIAILRDLAADMPVVVVTHSKLVAGAADRVFELRKPEPTAASRPWSGTGERSRRATASRRLAVGLVALVAVFVLRTIAASGGGNVGVGESVTTSVPSGSTLAAPATESAGAAACATPERGEVAVRFANTFGAADPAAFPLEVLFVDQQCDEVQRAVIPPAHDLLQRTTRGIRWRVRNAMTGELLIGIRAEPGLDVRYPCWPSQQQPLTIRFENRLAPSGTTGSRIRVYWVGRGCQEEEQMVLGSQTGNDQQTWAGHQWRLRRASDGRLLRDVVAAPGLIVAYP